MRTAAWIFCPIGHWRTRAWLHVRGYISPARKKGLRLITALRDDITGNPWLPTTIEMTRTATRSSDEPVFDDR